MTEVRAIDLELVTAAQEGNLAEVERLLAANADPNTTANPDPKHTKNWTPLHWASYKGHDAVVARLLDAKADPNVKDTKGLTPLYWSVSTGHEAIVARLLAAKADPNTKDTNGWTPLHSASDHSYEAIVAMLLAANANPNVNATDVVGWSPLHYACKNGDEAIVALLLAAKADPQNKDPNGTTPLHWASNNGHEAIVSLFFSDFPKLFADNLPTHQIAITIKNFAHSAELDTTLRNLYVEARRSLSNEQRKKAFPTGLGNSLLALLWKAPNDYHQATASEVRRKHTIDACAGGTFPRLLNDCVKSDVTFGSHKATDEVLSYLSPYWREQYRDTIGAAHATLARTSKLPGNESALSGFLRR